MAGSVSEDKDESEDSVEPAAPSGRDLLPKPASVLHRVAIVWFVLDQASKLLAVRMIGDGNSKALIDGLITIHIHRNRAGAFGFLAHLPLDLRTAFLVVVPLLIAGAIYRSLAHIKQSGAARWIGLIVGASASNLFDRLFKGGVVDLIRLQCDGHQLGTWNFADFGILIGMAGVCFMLAKSRLTSSASVARI
ncbi:MAG TPA: signal peptidase II [Polyangiaceae bacterium]|nr:signal peptidase II [Polyangiaceae bacterium]